MPAENQLFSCCDSSKWKEKEGIEVIYAECKDLSGFNIKAKECLSRIC